MCEPILVIRSNGSGELRFGRQLPEVKNRVVHQWKRGRADSCIRVLVDQSIKRVASELSCPVLIEPLLERATLICPAVVIIAYRHVRCDASKMRGSADGGEHLGRA